MHDAISAEKLGIPAVGVMTEPFLRTAGVMAGFLGLPEYPMACVAHPISHNTEAELRSKAEQIVTQALGIWASEVRGLRSG